MEARFPGPSPPERSYTSDLEEAEAWLASAEYLLEAAGQPRARFTVAIAQAIHAIIRSNDALTMRFLGRRSTRHDDAVVLFRELVRTDRIPPEFRAAPAASHPTAP